MAAAGLASLSLATPTFGWADTLRDGFDTPPQAARPQVWWHWMSGNVAWEGAKLDLDWMHRVGVGGVHAFSGGRLEPTVVDHPLGFMSPGWRDAYRRAVETAHGYGMSFTIAGSPGWSETGGPWVAPAQGMKKYVWSETEVVGGAPFHGVLAHPSDVTGAFLGAAMTKGFFDTGVKPPQAYGDSVVVAFPTPSVEIDRLPATYTSNAGALPGLAGAAMDLTTAIPLPVPAGDAKPFVDVDFGRRVRASSLVMAVSPAPAFQLLVSDDGAAFRPVATFEQSAAEHPAPQQTFAFAPVPGRVFRVLFDKPQPPRTLPGAPAWLPKAPPVSTLTLRRLSIGPAARANRFEAKAGFQSIADFAADPTPDAAAAAVVPTASVVDLTDKMAPDGRLDWDPPPGRWTVLRIGWSLTGQTNGPAEPSATGLEVDKLDAGAVKRYVDTLLSLYRDNVGAALGPQGIDSLLTDSWEAGVQNWTPAILADFRRLRGYDPTPWLPVLTGRVVGSAKAGDAFLFDFHQTLIDLVIQNHYAVLAAAAHARGMSYYTEVQGDTPRAIDDGMTAKAQADVPTGEFWFRPFATDPGQPPLVIDLEEAASAAHLYGKPLVAAEALTVAAGSDPWSMSPAMLKPVADEIFALGVNRILMHESHHQPFVGKKPGLELGFFGEFFNRNDTWAEEARPWSDYLARTSFMLQQGHAVADVAYVYGEEMGLTQRFQHAFITDVPKGYSFDFIDPQGLLTKLSVHDGRVATASGMSYRVIYLPPYVERMTLPTIRRLDALVRSGAVLVAAKPTGGLGLLSPDAEVLQAADALWGDGGASPVRKVGQGRVYGAGDLAAALKAEAIAPDANLHGADFMMQHRHTRDADIYFISNRGAEPLDAQIDFRVRGRAPEFWSADDASVRRLAFRQRDGATAVTVPLTANQAGFVVFRRPTTRPSLSLAAPHLLATQVLNGPWRVAFEPGRGAPAKATFSTLEDWSQNADPGVRYFSGAATYERQLVVSPAMTAAGATLLLDLGDVQALAVVSIDGHEVATAWKPPYSVDLTGRLTPGSHRLQVKVVNLWPNRLIGDKQPGATAVAYAPQSPYTARSPLLASGLLGPVRLLRETDPAMERRRP